MNRHQQARFLTISVAMLFTVWSLGVTAAFAQPRRGEVTSRPCPYSCRTEGLPAKQCRDWREGERCYVENLTKRATPPRRPAGYISTALCPHSCRTVGLPNHVCRDWREGDTCYVEDLTRLSDQAEPAVSPPTAPSGETTAPPATTTETPAIAPGIPSPTLMPEECRQARRYELGKPRVMIGRLRTRTPLSDRAEASGAVEGRCLVEAGYYEFGRLKEAIPVTATKDFRRFEFEIDVRRDRNPEIRVYNSAGEYDLMRLDERSQ